MSEGLGPVLGFMWLARVLRALAWLHGGVLRARQVQVQGRAREEWHGGALS